MAIGATALFCALLALACWPAGALPFAGALARDFVLLWVGMLASLAVYWLVTALFRLDVLDHFPIVLGLSIAPSLALAVLWAAKLNLNISLQLPSASTAGAIGLYAAGVLSCIPALWMIAAGHDGQASRTVLLLVMPLAFIVLAVFPALANAIAGWLM